MPINSIKTVFHEVRVSIPLVFTKLKRTSPELFESLRKEKCITGVAEDRPAVISVNMQLAATAANELLARLHNFRDDGNCDFAVNGISITQGELYLSNMILFLS